MILYLVINDQNFMTSRNDPCWCGSNQKWKKCHYPAQSPQNLTSQYYKQYGIFIKTPEQIEGIRAACQLSASILTKVCEAAKEGVTTEYLDDLAAKLHKEANAIAAPLNYGNPPYQKSTCISLNDVICHGIPGNRVLVKGDILNIDVSSIYNSYYGDTSRMVMIGEVSAERRRVVEVSKECMDRAANILKPGVLVSEIGEIIESYAEEQGCSVVYQCVGHGVGVGLHEAPQIPHNRNNLSIPLAAGMTFTIEPMINAGVPEGVVDSDQWTMRTADGKASAQWEHTYLITPTGYEILTAY